MTPRLRKSSCSGPAGVVEDVAEGVLDPAVQILGGRHPAFLDVGEREAPREVVVERDRIAAAQAGQRGGLADLLVGHPEVVADDPQGDVLGDGRGHVDLATDRTRPAFGLRTGERGHGGLVVPGHHAPQDQVVEPVELVAVRAEQEVPVRRRVAVVGSQRHLGGVGVDGEQIGPLEAPQNVLLPHHHHGPDDPSEDRHLLRRLIQQLLEHAEGVGREPPGDHCRHRGEAPPDGGGGLLLGGPRAGRRWQRGLLLGRDDVAQEALLEDHRFTALPAADTARRRQVSRGGGPVSVRRCAYRHARPKDGRIRPATQISPGNGRADPVRARR